ncbi:MAG: hypothetical protein LBQ54_04125 [Planctomycetaceae bacterium]|jgi:hypothetical protein|nr:hypothetical protein [Planctomycetaceae bacterium]
MSRAKIIKKKSLFRRTKNNGDGFGGNECPQKGQTRKGESMRKKETYRIVTRAANGELKFRDYDSEEEVLKRHVQIGIDDCSTDLGLRGRPVFRGLIGPMPETGNIVRYESPEVFETLTKEWSAPKKKSRRKRVSLD